MSSVAPPIVKKSYFIFFSRTLLPARIWLKTKNRQIHRILYHISQKTQKRLKNFQALEKNDILAQKPDAGFQFFLIFLGNQIDIVAVATFRVKKPVLFFADHNRVIHVLTGGLDDD